MKKTFKLLMLALVGMFALASCEDVPAPYPNPNGETNDKTDEIIAPVGDGTLQSPYNVAGVVAFIETLGTDVTSNEAVYVKGKVKSNSTTESTISQYGNMTFTMVDEGNSTTTFTAFQVYGPDKKKFTSVDQIKEGDEVIVYGKVVNFRGNTPETEGKGNAYVCSINGEGDNGDDNQDDNVEASGTGTQADPFNVAGIIKYTSALEADANSTEQVYFKGIVESFKSGEEPGNSYGNATFYIKDKDGSKTFYCFRVMGPGNKKFTSADQLKEGDEVVVCGNVVNYKGNTPETVSGKAYVYSINGVGDNEDNNQDDNVEASGTGTQAAPFNVAGIIKYTSAMAADVNSTEQVYFKGIVDSFKSGEEPGNSYGNATFYIKDKDGSKTFYCFRVMGPGNKKFTSADQLKEGDEVVVCGNVVNYKGNTPETVSGKAYVYSINGKVDEGGNTEGGNTEGGNTEGGNTGGNTGDNTALSSLQNGDFESWASDTEPTGWKSASTASSAKLTKSSTAHGGNYAVEVEGNESSNKRLASQEITLEAGTYTFSFYAKAKEAGKSQVRPGYVPVTDGKVGNYSYGDYATLNNGEWTLVSYEFKLDAKTTICLVVMNPKKSDYSDGKAALIDDATLTKK
ncbi:MAG: carbohydrate binding domain-containing protein [Bacteroidaceae bacterium]|nr:carbohydrate binding domain-containing protein [Bacteroidaceae bacterium]